MHHFWVRYAHSYRSSRCEDYYWVFRRIVASFWVDLVKKRIEKELQNFTAIYSEEMNAGKSLDCNIYYTYFKQI